MLVAALARARRRDRCCPRWPRSIAVMLIGRVIQGVGGGVLPLSFGIIRDEFPAEQVPRRSRRDRGARCGGWRPRAGARRADRRDLRLPLAVLDPDGRARAVAGSRAAFVVPESPVRSPGRLHGWPAVLLSGWLVALLLAVSEAPSWGWGSGRVLGLLAIAVVLAAAWVRGRDPLVPPAHRHADDADPGGVDHEPGRIAVRRRDVRDVRVPAGVPADPVARRDTASARASRTSGLILLPLSAMMFVFGVASGRLTLRYRRQSGADHRFDDQRRAVPSAGGRARPVSGRSCSRSRCWGSASGWRSRRCRT